MSPLQAMRRSIRGKSMAALLATALFALLVSALALFYYNFDTYTESQLAELRTQAQILGRSTAPALAFKDPKAAAQDLDTLRVRPDISAAAVYAPDGTLFASYLRPGREAAVPRRAGGEGHEVEGDAVTLVQPIVEDGQLLGSVYLNARSGLRERMRDYLGILSLVMVAALAAAFLLSTWLQHTLTRPILDVTSAAREVFQRRDFSVRARKSTDDEIGELADALNRMLADLEREMTERQEAERALRAADRRKDEFLATLAHELRNPLAPIRNALYIMQTARDNPAAVAEGRAIIERQLAQLVRLVDDLLDVSRITTGKLALRRQPVDLRAVAESALESIEPLAQARGHRLHLALPPPGVVVNADPTRLAQVFLNLLNNAVKFTDPGGRIDFELGVQEGELVATVRDTGIGIAPELRDEIFEIFAQADRSLERSTMGLGVGLSLARRLVELHGGSISATSEGPGRGAQFVVRVPVQDSAKRPPVRQGGEAKAREPSIGKHRILLADDNLDFANSFATVLRRMGNEVRVEHDGPTALAAASEFRPDVAFLDIGLPKLNGFDLARRLRELPATGASILVAVTGWGQPSDRQLAREAGFDDYVVKPVEIERIQSILRAA